jgi:hypothetical protein
MIHTTFPRKFLYLSALTVLACSSPASRTPTESGGEGGDMGTGGSTGGSGGKAATGGKGGGGTGGTSTPDASASTGGSGPGTGGSPSTPPDASAPDSGGGGTAVGDLVGKLSKTLFKQTIAKLDPDGRSGCGLTAEMTMQGNEDTLKGDAAKTYEVTFRVRGLWEPRMVQGGMADPASPFINVGGMAHQGGAENQRQYSNIRLETADPKQVYHLNTFHMGHTDHTVYPMDYKLKVKAKGGSKVSFVLQDGNACMIANKMLKVVEGVPADVVMQPFKDQFLYVEAESATEAP